MKFIRIPYRDGALALNPVHIRSAFYKSDGRNSSLEINTSAPNDAGKITVRGQEADRVWAEITASEGGETY